MTPILPTIQFPADLKSKTLEQLQQLADEIRRFIIDVVSVNGGHLGASLGVVELTIALHYVFDTPVDKLVWDVGHQAYVHKILTGRKADFETNRQKNGLSGFPKISESEYDAFGVGHSSTSISAALGMAIASKLKGENDIQHVAVIGDASIASGMAFEALNHAGVTNANLIVVLNDNAIGIDPSVGALKSYLMQVKQGENPKSNNMIKSLNFKYVGPIDGHDLKALIHELQRLKAKSGPQFLHITTTKGKGLKQAEENQVLYHAPGKFDKITGDLLENNTQKFTKYQDVFGLTLLELAQQNPKIFAITPAMPTGSSLKYMMDQFPERAIDVGIAEQHAVTLAAGISLGGFTVFCAIYSTFLQRAYDQLIHDVALQSIPVIFCIDRAGLVGEDGATHQGVFDIAYLQAIPNLTILAPKDAVELRQTLFTLQNNSKPVAIRYPRGYSSVENWKVSFEKIDLSKIQLIKRGKKAAVFSTGTILENVLEALSFDEDYFAVHHFLQIKPLNKTEIVELISGFETIITVEEGVIKGGFGSVINQIILANNINIKVINLGVPDVFIEHATVNEQLKQCGLDVEFMQNLFKKVQNV
ncbi:1-deoxy-D-xylulose-5-phosphate synthase [Paenimyroides ummariense]|uniref:1-deoxy-D-xylulose-5-phosphate synthase n=1 Tax=Paenimyroides ummariense TaxID=913024 RepID=A0A1I4W5F2_9FLAO|nr:1-deoxy-D-xylulose-5-phosphate synthase [Paenimyroides ummariense]SFN08755.1 1-deoxy-D-xylulose-5-phosphate synthase [Paenimyroides ummariense]